MNEAELEVDSEKASYKQKLEVLQQQEELIEDEKEQEEKEEIARKAQREEEARLASQLLPESEVYIHNIHRRASIYNHRSSSPRRSRSQRRTLA